MNVRDIEGLRSMPHVAAQAHRREELKMVRKRVGHVAKHPDVHAMGVGIPRRRPGLVVARVGRADGDAVSPPCESARHCGRQTRDPAVGPRLLVVGNNVQDTEAPVVGFYLVLQGSTGFYKVRSRFEELNESAEPGRAYLKTCRR